MKKKKTVKTKAGYGSDAEKVPTYVDEELYKVQGDSYAQTDNPAESYGNIGYTTEMPPAIKDNGYNNNQPPAVNMGYDVPSGTRNDVMGQPPAANAGYEPPVSPVAATMPYEQPVAAPVTEKPGLRSTMRKPKEDASEYGTDEKPKPVADEAFSPAKDLE